MLDGRLLSEQLHSDVMSFLEQQVGENLTLDYKRELSDSPRSRGELCRDVSALANSQGGTIIYGVDEQTPDRTPVLPPYGTPRRVSNQPVEEWAAQVIRDGVQPRIDLELEPFDLPNDPDRCILIVRTTASPLAPHMVTLRGTNHHGRFYRRSNYENRIAEEYEVREMLERARRLYLGVEVELARRGYSDPSSVGFGNNPYTRRLADRLRHDEETRHRLPAEMWASFVLLPTSPSNTRQDRSSWLSWLDPDERKYEPEPTGLFLPYHVKRPVLNGVACLSPHYRGGAADLDEYLLLGFDGLVEFGFAPAVTNARIQDELGHYFRGVTLLYRLWQFLNFAADVRSRLVMVAPHFLVVNLKGTGGAALADFARGWMSPLSTNR